LPKFTAIDSQASTFRGDVSMWKQRAVTLYGYLAMLPLIVGCTDGVGGPLQAFTAPPPRVAAAADTGSTQVYAAGPAAPSAILMMLPGAGDWEAAKPQLWAAQGFDVVTPAPSEIYRIAADQQVAAARLLAEAQAMPDAPLWLVGPDRAIEAAMTSLPRGEPGQVSGVVMTVTALGTRTCSEQMIYSYAGHGTAPRVSVSKPGNACSAGLPFGGAGANFAITLPVPQVRPHAPRILKASTPAAAAPPAAQHAAVQQIADLVKSAPPS
jgi:hypothetical protein